MTGPRLGRKRPKRACSLYQRLIRCDRSVLCIIQRVAERAVFVTSLEGRRSANGRGERLAVLRLVCRNGLEVML